MKARRKKAKMPMHGGKRRGMSSVTPDVTNRPAENATRWFWLLESPEKAHVNYEEV
jgi:hypothetical protein